MELTIVSAGQCERLKKVSQEASGLLQACVCIRERSEDFVLYGLKKVPSVRVSGQTFVEYLVESTVDIDAKNVNVKSYQMTYLTWTKGPGLGA